MFKPNSAELIDGMLGTLDKTGDMLQKDTKIKITIEGHSAAIGKPDFEMKISEDRASSIKDYLVTKFGLAADRIKTVGYGSSKPIADNSTQEGKAKNRRVEYFVGHGEAPVAKGKEKLS